MLKLSDSIYVDVNTREWVQEFRRYGPFVHSLLSVERIIELLNQGYDVVIPEKWQFDVFTLVSTYNEFARREKRKVADLAERVLRVRLNKEVAKELTTIKNPYKDDNSEKSEIRVVRKIQKKMPKALIEQGVGGQRIVQVRKPKVYDMLAGNEPIIVGGNDSESFLDAIDLSTEN